MLAGNLCADTLDHRSTSWIHLPVVFASLELCVLGYLGSFLVAFWQLSGHGGFRTVAPVVVASLELVCLDTLDHRSTSWNYLPVVVVTLDLCVLGYINLRSTSQISSPRTHTGHFGVITSSPYLVTSNRRA